MLFPRTYDNGTEVRLTAPSSASGNIFQKWQRNGVDFSTNPSISVIMNGNYTMTAVYETQGCLSVTPPVGLISSGNEGGPFSPSSLTYTLTNTGGTTINYSVTNLQTWISLSGNTSGFLSPSESRNVTVSINNNANNLSPDTYSGTVNFINNTGPCGDITRPVSLTVNQVITPPTTHTLSVNSANPNSGAYIHINRNDNDGQASGIAPFTRTYDDSTVILLTADEIAGGNNFEKWQRDGIDWDTNRRATVAIDADHTMTAVYTPSDCTTWLNSVDTLNANSVYVSGNTAYVADRSSGLQTINVFTPSAPVPLDSYDTPGDALDVFVSDGIAYVADGPSGLQIIDVSNPSDLKFLGNYDTPSVAFGVHVSDKTAYVADFWMGLQIIDVSKSPPVSLGSYRIIGHPAMDVYVSGTTAYVAYGDIGLQILNVSDPTNPTFLGSYDTPGAANGVYVSGNTAYIADGEGGGLQIIDVSDPTDPKKFGSYDTVGDAQDVYVLNNIAYVADTCCLQIIDVSNPTGPSLLDSYDTSPGEAYGVYVLRNTAYVADGSGGLEIIDISGCEASCPTYCSDADEDTYGNPSDSVQDCIQPLGYVSDCTDCNDNDPNEHPNQTWYKDGDNDGYSDGTTITSCTRSNGYKMQEELTAISGDCDDNNSNIHPGVQEQCNEVDDDCDRQIDEDCCTDNDNDGYNIQSNCGTLVDCNDNDPKEHPTQTWYKDGDNDGYSDGTTITSCRRPNGYKVEEALTAISGDCDDNNASIHPNATEDCDDGKDNDCDGFKDCDDPDCQVDNDRDGCYAPPCGNDCDDNDLNDCEGNTYCRDADNDGYGVPTDSVLACTQPPEYVLDCTDCNDNDQKEHPTQTWHKDADNDGYSDGTTNTASCKRPDGYKVLSELIATSGDCDDTNLTINPKADEICNDVIDNDCDELPDCFDPDCDCDPACQTGSECADTTYAKVGSFVKFNLRRSSKDKALIRLCIDDCFCETLKKGIDEIVLWLDECNKVTIPGSKLRLNRKKTKFIAKAFTYKLTIDCRTGWLKLKLKNTNLQDCVSNPIKTCVQITDGPCLCAEEEFVEQEDKKGRLKKLLLKVTEACAP